MYACSVFCINSAQALGERYKCIVACSPLWICFVKYPCLFLHTGRLKGNDTPRFHFESNAWVERESPWLYSKPWVGSDRNSVIRSSCGTGSFHITKVVAISRTSRNHRKQKGGFFVLFWVGLLLSSYLDAIWLKIQACQEFHHQYLPKGNFEVNFTFGVKQWL